jgi:hypothetical protein
MQRTARPFVLRTGPVLGTLLEKSESFDVEASGLDGLRARTHAELAQRGHRVRAVSFTPTGLVAYVEAAS